MEIESLIRPWFEQLQEQVPGIEIFDAHTHLGQNDPDGFKQTPQELLAILDSAQARGCFVFPMHEPDGYPPANDEVLEVAERVGERFVPFCRVNPHDHALEEAERSLAAGMKGIKLHPRAEQFTLDHPAVRSLFALADERSLPILIHAGRGIPALGVHVIELAAEFPNARPILAHAAVCDLGWIWRAVADVPNVLFDSAWWMPADLMSLFTFVPPAQILFASDAPYGHTLASAASQFRLAQQAGLSPEQIRLIASGQSLRVAAGEPLAVAGPAVGERDQASHLLLDRVAQLLQLGTVMNFRGAPEGGAEMLALARLACDVPPEIDDAPTFAAIRLLLDAYDVLSIETPEDRRVNTLLMLATTVAKTPDVPLARIEYEDWGPVPN